LAHVTDLMPTFEDIASAQHPASYKGHDILPLEGRSLLPIFKGGTRTNAAPVFWEHEGNRAVRSDKWKLVSRYPGPWELYDVEADRTEQHNLAAEQPETVREMAAQYEQWARRCNVLPLDKLPGAKPTPPAKTGADD